jgi:two-component system, NtrC family, sensor kinase
MKAHSLRTKLIGLFFIFFLFPYGLLAFFSVSTTREMMKKSTMDHLQNLVEVKETAIEQWVAERVGDGKTIAQSEAIKSLDSKRIEPFLRFAHFERAYLELWVLDAKGRMVAGNSSKISYEQEDWFQGAMEKGAYISTPVLQAQSLRPVMTISSLIADSDGRRIGVLKELVDLAYVSELISESKLGRTGELFIVNPRGEFILRKGLPDLLKKGLTQVPYFEKNFPRPNPTGVYKDDMGNEVVGSWKWISNLRCYLIAEQDTAEAFHDIDLLVRKALIILAISALLIFGVSYGVIGRVIRPIRGLSEAVDEFADGRFGKTLSTSRKDEIGKLVAGFNAMAGKLKKAYTDLEGKVEASNQELGVAYEMLKKGQEQLIRSEKMAALGQLSAGIAHEIRTPITSIKIFVQSLAKEIGLSDSEQEDFRIILREIDRINEIITRFLDFARPEEPVLQNIDLGVVVKDTVNLMAAKLKNSGVRLRLSLPEESPHVLGDPKQLTQVFLNLLLNAVEAMPDGGELMIRSDVVISPESGQEFLRVAIQDTGQGIAEKDRPYLFDPFFTKKPGGTGMGLAIVYSIVQKHNGRIEVESEYGKGASFILSLPIHREKTWKESW